MQLGVLTYDSPQSNLITQRLLRRRPSAIRGIVRAVTIGRGRPNWRTFAALAARVAPDFLAWKVAEAAVSRAAWSFGGAAAIPTLADLAAKACVPLIDTRDVNAPDTVATLRRWGLDLAVSVHFPQRIGPAALATPRLGMLNVHGALLPRNRGLFPYFWELANGDDEAGVTVHWIDDRLDCGDVVLQRTLAIAASETMSSLAWKGAELGGTLLCETMDLAEAGTASRSPQHEAGASYYGWPGRADTRRLRARGRRLGSVGDAWRRVLGRNATVAAVERSANA